MTTRTVKQAQTLTEKYDIGIRYSAKDLAASVLAVDDMEEIEVIKEKLYEIVNVYRIPYRVNKEDRVFFFKAYNERFYTIYNVTRILVVEMFRDTDFNYMYKDIISYYMVKEILQRHFSDISYLHDQLLDLYSRYLSIMDALLILEDKYQLGRDKASLVNLPNTTYSLSTILVDLGKLEEIRDWMWRLGNFYMDFIRTPMGNTNLKVENLEELPTQMDCSSMHILEIIRMLKKCISTGTLFLRLRPHL